MSETEQVEDSTDGSSGDVDRSTGSSIGASEAADAVPVDVGSPEGETGVPRPDEEAAPRSEGSGAQLPDEETDAPLPADDSLADGESDDLSGSGSTSTGRASIRSGPEPDAGEGLRWKSVAALGIVAFVAGIGVVLAPVGTVPAMRPETIEALRSLALGLGAVAGLAGLVLAYNRSAEATVDDGPAAVELPVRPEGAHGEVNDVAGSRLDEAIAAVGGRVDGGDDTYTVFKLRNSVEGLAVRVLATSTDCSTEAAREQIRTGAWTDDVRAAAFLGGPDAPSMPLSMRLRDWASGRALERRIEATVDELARIAGVEES